VSGNIITICGRTTIFNAFGEKFVIC